MTESENNSDSTDETVVPIDSGHLSVHQTLEIEDSSTRTELVQITVCQENMQFDIELAAGKATSLSELIADVASEVSQ